MTSLSSCASFTANAPLTILDWAGHRGAVSYTFDDTQPSQIEHWQELKALGIPMTFYCWEQQKGLTGFSETWKDAIASGCEIGNHTVGHKHWAEITPAQGLAELDSCSRFIRQDLGQMEAATFAHPFGDTGWNEAVRQRFCLARSVNGGMIRPNDSTNPLLLPVFMARGDEDITALKGPIDDAKRGEAWLIFVFHAILPTEQNWYAGVEMTSIEGSVAHAKKADLWIDTVANIGSYWLGQRIFTHTQPQVSGGAWTWNWELPEHFPGSRFLLATAPTGRLSQNGKELEKDVEGRYRIALGACNLTWQP